MDAIKEIAKTAIEIATNPIVLLFEIVGILGFIATKRPSGSVLAVPNV